MIFNWRNVFFCVALPLSCVFYLFFRYFCLCNVPEYFQLFQVLHLCERDKVNSFMWGWVDHRLKWNSLSCRLIFQIKSKPKVSHLEMTFRELLGIGSVFLCGITINLFLIFPSIKHSSLWHSVYMLVISSVDS